MRAFIAALLLPSLAWPCVPLIDKQYWAAPTPLVAIEARAAEKDWQNVIRWVGMATGGPDFMKLSAVERRRVRELGARAELKLHRYAKAVEQLTTLQREAKNDAVDQVLLEATLRQAEFNETNDREAVRAAWSRAQAGGADEDLRVALVLQLRRGGRAEDAKALCSELQKSSVGAEAKSVCAGPVPKTRPVERLGGCS